MEKEFDTGFGEKERKEFVNGVLEELNSYKKPKLSNHSSPTDEKKWLAAIKNIKREDLLQMEKELGENESF